MGVILSTAPSATDAQETRIRRAWSALAGSLTVLALLAVVEIVVDGFAILHVAVAALVALTAAAAAIHRRQALQLETHRRVEVESFARILQGLSRSVSSDAIVEAIVEDLGEMTGADHIVVVRLRPNTGLLEATLVTNRQGIPSSTTVLPISDLDGGEGERSAVPGQPGRVAVGPGRALDGDETMVAEDERLVRVASSPRWRSTGDAVLARVDPGRSDARGLRRGASVVDSGREPGAAEAASQRVAERLALRVRSTFGLKHTIVAPLETATGVVGAIILSRRTADPWPRSATRLMAAAATEASAALARAYSHRAAEERASTDALTSLPNRRYFDEICGLVARRRRADDAVGMLMIDIDHFKAVNDRHGHAVGDQVLRAVAAAIVSAVREDDVPARYGGEEFVVLLRNPAPGVASDVGERVRSAVRGLDLSAHGVEEVTVSVGVAVAASPDDTIPELLAQADRALYVAKRAGRDRVVAA